MARSTKQFMSKLFLGHYHHHHAAQDRDTGKHHEKDQIAAFYELGLLMHSSISGTRSTKHRSREGNRDWEGPGGKLAGFHPKKNSSTTNNGFARGISGTSLSSPTLSDFTAEVGRSGGKRVGGGMGGMLDNDRSRTRRERTFVGSECAVCDEPLEHTLRGERILQFSCGHVSHEACFYEYIKEFESQYCPTCNAPLGLDMSRGGNVLDIEKLSNIVRSVSATDRRSQSTPTPTPWDSQTVRPPSTESNVRQGEGARDSRDATNGNSRDSMESRDRVDRYASTTRTAHSRNDSEATGAPSSVGYPEIAVSGGAPHRRHDYDVQSMETTLPSPRPSTARNPIPPPAVSVRSEFPTLTRSRQQQTLTCLVTIEVPDNKWRPDPDDLRSNPPLPSGRTEDNFPRPPLPVQSPPRFVPYEPPEVLEEITESLRMRVENWQGLDFNRFGKLRLYGAIRVGKDKQSWQELECYLFSEMLICVKEKKSSNTQQWDENPGNRKRGRCTLKGSILIKKHLNEVTESGDENILTLSLSVAELPSFHLKFDNRNQLKLWQQALLDLNAVEQSPIRSPDYDLSETDEDDWHRVATIKGGSSLTSSNGAGRSITTAPTEYTTTTRNAKLPTTVHVPVDIVVVVPLSPSMQGVKISLVRDALKFMVHNLGKRDRMGLVAFGSGGGGTPLVGMTTKHWNGWSGILSSIRPSGQKNHRADVVEGANVAMDLLMQRRSTNPIATILLISDSSTSDTESVDFVVSRAEAAKVAIHSFGLGMTHKPDTMIELSAQTKASYTYVKDWMMLRECVAGCLGALQTVSHQNVKLKLRLPEGSPAKFVKISGALQITKRATGKEAEASLGDLRFGDKRDILVQLVITPDNASQEHLPQDPWESIVSGLEALGGSLEQEEQRTVSIEEVPLIQADLTWSDVLRDGILTHMPRPSLLAITMLPASTASQKKSPAWPNTPPIPPHPLVVQRRMELLTSDMLTRALTLVSRGQHDRAQHLLNETRSILKGLAKGGLPPIPPTPSKSPNPNGTSNLADTSPPTSTISLDQRRTPSPTSVHTTASNNTLSAPPIHRHQSNDALATSAAPGIDTNTVSALDIELESSLEWINHPAVFGRDSRKAVLQAIGVISSQRGYTFRTPVECLWARRVRGIKNLTERSREWREEGGGDVGIMEES